MSQDVNIMLKGLHTNSEDDVDDIELIIPGQYYFRNGKHFVCYEETDEETSVVTKNVLKFCDNYVELIKRGNGNSKLVFETNQTHYSYYSTAFGNLFLGVNTKSINCTSSGDLSFNIEIDYALEMNQQKLSDCHVQIVIDTELKP